MLKATEAELTAEAKVNMNADSCSIKFMFNFLRSKKLKNPNGKHDGFIKS